MITERRVPLEYSQQLGHRMTATATHVESFVDGVLARVTISVTTGSTDRVFTTRAGRSGSAHVTYFDTEATVQMIHYGNPVRTFDHKSVAKDMPWLTGEVPTIKPVSFNDAEIHVFVEGKGKLVPGIGRMLKVVEEYVAAQDVSPEVDVPVPKKSGIWLPKTLIVKINRPDPPSEPTTE